MTKQQAIWTLIDCRRILIDGLVSVQAEEITEAFDMAIEALQADRPTGEWKEVYAETDYRNGWIEFSCECCGHQHGLESGEYGWSYGEPIPWKFCPLCGAKMNKGGDDDADE